MTGSVFERLGHTIDAAGCIHYDDRPLSWPEADKRAERRLDRRKAYAFIDGEVCELVRWTVTCSGCSGWVGGDLKGSGCRECGFRGVVRSGAYLPVPKRAALKEDRP